LIDAQAAAGPAAFAATFDFDASDVSAEADAATDRIRRWHETYAALVEDRATEPEEQVVRLGDHVGATTFLRALRNPEDVAMDLLRPMPRQPSQAAARGIAWHAWVETVFGQQSLLGVDELPGAADEDIATDDQLEELKRAFERTGYAGREPVAVERGFSVVVGGRVISGRIDAVFEKDGRFEVVDWKTGGTASVDTHQLAIYRVAWAQIAGVDWRDVDAVFVMVASGQQFRPNTDAEVEALLDLG
jgi:DNA helicase-2/ATP-dependent DNA helicase PcrA